MQENLGTVSQERIKAVPTHLRRELPNGITRRTQGYIVSTEYSDLECIDLATGINNSTLCYN